MVYARVHVHVLYAVVATQRVAAKQKKRNNSSIVRNKRAASLNILCLVLSVGLSQLAV